MKNKITILPHDRSHGSFYGHIQEDLIQAIRRLPQGSILAVDMTGKQLASHAIQMLRGESVGEPDLPLFELLLEVGKRNLKLIPLINKETAHAAALADEWFMEIRPPYPIQIFQETLQVRQRIEREAAMRIKALVDHHKSNIVVLALPIHLRGINAKLLEMRIPSRIELAPFRDRGLIAQHLRNEQAYRADIRAKKIAKLNKPVKVSKTRRGERDRDPSEFVREVFESRSKMPTWQHVQPKAILRAGIKRRRK